MSFLMVFWINSIKFRSNPTPRIIIADQKLRQPWLINSMQQRHNAESFLGFSSNEEEIRKCIQDKLYRLFYGFYKPSVKLNTKIWRKSFKQENHPDINKISVDIKEMMLEDSRWKKKNKSCVTRISQFLNYYYLRAKLQRTVLTTLI